MKPDDRLLFVREAEGVYRVGHGKIRALVKSKLLRSFRRGKRTLVSVKELDENLERLLERLRQGVGA